MYFPAAKAGATVVAPRETLLDGSRFQRRLQTTEEKRNWNERNSSGGEFWKEV